MTSPTFTIGLLTMPQALLHPVVMYTIVFIGMSFVYLGMAWILHRIDLSRNALFLALAAAFLIRLTLIPAAPAGSDDIYRYMWDGKVQDAGINPYLYAPDSSALSHLHSALLPTAVNHPAMKTLYFPFAEWVFSLGYQISGESPVGLKLLFVLAEAAAIIGLIFLLRHFRIPEKYVLFYAFSPLSILQFSLDGHVDALGFPFLIFGLLLYQRNRVLPALVLFGLSMSVKPVALVVLPILFFATPDWRRRLQVAGIPLATIGVQFLPYVRSSNPFESLFVFAKNWTFNGGVFELLNAGIADNQKTRVILFLLLGITLLLLSLSKRDLREKIYLSVLLLLLFSPVVHPWYIAWLAIVLPLTQRWSGIVYVAAASLASLTILQYKLYGVWEQSPILLAIEYLPVLYLAWQEVRHTPAQHDVRSPRRATPTR